MVTKTEGQGGVGKHSSTICFSNYSLHVQAQRLLINPKKVWHSWNKAWYSLLLTEATLMKQLFRGLFIQYVGFSGGTCSSLGDQREILKKIDIT